MQKLFTPQNLDRYLTEGSRHVHGYLQSGSASVICSLFDIQDELNISGNIAEIGVFHGKLFILLCHSLRAGEQAFAIDPFNTQPDIQGIKTEEDRQTFSSDNLLNNIVANDINPELTQLIIANSQDLTGSDLSGKLGDTKIRLFSIDGDHSRNGVRHDMNLAAETIGYGGVAIIDDLFNTICPSLTEGIIDFFRDDNIARIEPIAIIAANGPVHTGSSKLLVSDAKYAHQYKAYLQLLNRTNYSHTDDFLGYPHVLIFDFKQQPQRHPLNDDVRQAVSDFLKEQT